MDNNPFPGNFSNQEQAPQQMPDFMNQAPVENNQQTQEFADPFQNATADIMNEAVGPSSEQAPFVQEQAPQQAPVQPEPQQAPQQAPVQPEPQQEVQQAPLQSVTPSYSPNVDQNNIIGVISPANFDNLIKVLKTLTGEKSADNIVIRQSLVKQGTTEYIIEADLTGILNYNNKFIDLDIINPSKYVPLFGQFRSQNNIFIIDDDNNSRFIITNGEIKLFLPKQEDTETSSIEGFNLTGSQTIATRKIDKETRKVIKGLAKGQDYIEFLIQDNKFKGIHIPNTAIYVFPEFQNDKGSDKLDETNADLILRTSGFLPVEADQYDFFIVMLNDNTYISLVDCNIGGQIKVRITEQCEQTTGGNLII